MNIVEENWEQILNKMKLENYVPAWSTLKKNTCFLLKYVLQKSQDTNMKSLS